MKIEAIKTRVFHKKENLHSFVIEHIPELKENEILFITSKLLSLAQNKVVDKRTISKRELVESEADILLGETYQTYLTIKNGILIPAAGIDESNSEDEEYILWPDSPYEEAKKLQVSLREHYNIKNLGLIFTDSRCTPLRRGVSGIGIAHWGFKGVQDHIGKEDLFGRKITMSTTNVVDCLSSAAVLVMGESSESCPIAIMRDYSRIEFTDEVNYSELIIETKRDIFRPLFSELL